MLKVKFGTAESKLKKHIGTDHSFCAQRRSDRAEKRNLLSAVPQFTFSSHAIYFQHFPYYQHRSTPRPRQDVSTGRGGLLRLTTAENNILAEHAGGEVALWSSRGCEVGRWSKPSSAAMLYGEGDLQRLMLPRQGGLEKLEPGKAACS